MDEGKIVPQLRLVIRKIRVNQSALCWKGGNWLAKWPSSNGKSLARNALCRVIDQCLLYHGLEGIRIEESAE